MTAPAHGRYQHERTQNERVLRALVEAGPRGVNPLDFLQLPTPDAGRPILRFASRIRDLRLAGHEIETRRRGRTVTYLLVRERASATNPAPPSLDPALFTRAIGAAAPRGPYDPDPEDA